MKKVSYNVVNNYIKTLGRWVVPKLKTAISRKNLEHRKSYCEENIDHILGQDVLFMDESLFELNRNKAKVFQFLKTAMPEVEKLSTWVKQMVFAGLLKSARRDILNLFPDEFHFVQDNAKPHKHLNSMRYIQRWLIPHIKDYPPQSPDLNPIEIVWARLKKMVELQRPKNKQGLRDSIVKCWNQLSLDFIRKCIRGLPNKMPKAIDDATAKLTEAEEPEEEETVDGSGAESDNSTDEAAEIYLSEDSKSCDGESLSED